MDEFKIDKWNPDKGWIKFRNKLILLSIIVIGAVLYYILKYLI